MIAPWVFEEMKTAHFNDKRLDHRLAEVLSELAAHPTASIPAACGGRAEMVAAYRLFENPKTNFTNALQPHIDSAWQRIAAQSVVLLAQDTTEVDITRPTQQVAGAGPLDGNSRRGVLLHMTHAFTPDGTPLGTVDAKAWSRDEEPINRNLTRAQRAAVPFEEKESCRWVETMRRMRERAKDFPATRLLCLADSEADIYEYFAEATSEPAGVSWIVRACQDRALSGENGEETEEKPLRERLLREPESFRKTISVRGREAKVSCETRGRRQPRKSRRAEVAVRAARVTLRPPRRADRKLPAVTVNVVLVREIDPPPDDEPIEWLLITDLPVETIEQLLLVIQYYCVRWMIEVYFRVLKSGCRIEERLFEYLDRLLTAVAVYMIVAWRTLYVCRLGRSCPEISCEAVFEPAEWQSVWRVVRRESPPAQPPPLGEFVRLVAQLGGYVNGKRANPPGPQTLWIGLQRMHDFATCWLLFGPGAQSGS
jgi:hypothetical protein